MQDKSATRIVQINILAMQFVVTMPIIIQSLVEDFTKPRLILAVGYMMTAINFFHGKIATLDDKGYYRTVNFYPTIGLADFFLNTLSVLLFLIIACVFTTHHLTLFIVMNIILRCNDSILVMLVRNISVDQTTRKAQVVWLSVNCGFILTFLFCFYYFNPVSSHWYEISIIFLSATILDILLDYTLNRQMYFTVKRTWDDLAQYWDFLQGQHGDLYRRKIILPYLKNVFNPLQNKKVLDLGSGNGCVARFLDEQGATVTAVDKFDSMLTIARSYTNNKVKYLKVDLDQINAPINSGNFDLIIACFSFQDCNGLNNPFRVIESNLSNSGKAIVIYENKDSFETDREQSSTTRRLWLDSSKLNGKGRRQLIFWEPKAILIGQGVDAFNNFVASGFEQDFATITHYWSEEKYIEIAKKNNLVVLSSNVLNIHDNIDASQTIRRYIQTPKFNITIFEKQNSNE